MGQPAQKLPQNGTAPETPAKPAGSVSRHQSSAAAAPRPQSALAPTSKKLKKGEILFKEGENSRSMYFLKAGMIRIFKNKGEASIEIDTIHTGAVLGELAFLDGNPRSASAEALTDCELVEVSGQVFTQTFQKMPDWLKILLKTVVQRLRTASTRIRQMEAASTAVDYSNKDGKRQVHYVYLNPHDILKICTAILLVASRNGETAPKGVQLRVGLLQRYANQIMGVPVAKITSVLDALAQIGLMSLSGDTGYSTVVLNDIEQIEQYVAYQNEQNLVEPSKQINFSLKSFLIMSLISKHLGNYKADPVTGAAQVNLAEIKKAETALRGGKEPFRYDEIEELVKMGMMSNLTIKNNDEAFTIIKVEEFSQMFKLQKIVKTFVAANEQKASKK